jgi:hypothetical protein
MKCVILHNKAAYSEADHATLETRTSDTTQLIASILKRICSGSRARQVTEAGPLGLTRVNPILSARCLLGLAWK